ncbi:MAG: hypothetical protein WD271_02535 [Acidimicrobiia bacterium]
MPWCDTCDRFLSPSTVRADGACPTCGRAVDPGSAHSLADAPADDDDALGPIPWHLKLLAGALAVYLGWRAWQGIEWVAHNL